MSKPDSKIIERIRKCFALGRDSGATEAEAAHCDANSARVQALEALGSPPQRSPTVFLHVVEGDRRQVALVAAFAFAIWLRCDQASLRW